MLECRGTWIPRLRAEDEVWVLRLLPERRGVVNGLNIQKMRMTEGFVLSFWFRLVRLRFKRSTAVSGLNQATHAFELLHKSSNFLKHALLFGQVLRMQWTHRWQNGIQFGAIVTGELALE